MYFIIFQKCDLDHFLYISHSDASPPGLMLVVKCLICSSGRCIRVEADTDQSCEYIIVIVDGGSAADTKQQDPLSGDLGLLTDDSAHDNCLWGEILLLSQDALTLSVSRQIWWLMMLVVCCEEQWVWLCWLLTPAPVWQSAASAPLILQHTTWCWPWPQSNHLVHPCTAASLSQSEAVSRMSLTHPGNYCGPDWKVTLVSCLVICDLILNKSSLNVCKEMLNRLKVRLFKIDLKMANLYQKPILYWSSETFSKLWSGNSWVQELSNLTNTFHWMYLHSSSR